MRQGAILLLVALACMLALAVSKVGGARSTDMVIVLIASACLILIGTVSAFRVQLRSISQDLNRLGLWIRHWEQGQPAQPPPIVKSQQANALRDDFSSMTQKVRLTLDKMQEVAQKDPLTGLPNRAFFEQMVRKELTAAAEKSAQSCLIFLDIDGFKNVNDSLGHHVGDQLIKIAADRLKITTRLDDYLWQDGADEDTQTGAPNVARIGGDEFTIFLPRVPSEAVALKVATRVLRVLSEPFELGAHAVGVTASIGIAMVPRDGHSYIDLLRAADTAMYHAKRSGRNRVELYNSTLDEEMRQLAEAEQDLRGALALSQFELFYQPLYDCRTKQIVSAEALIRWRHPVRGIVMPSEFIPLAEKANLINQIGEWVISEAATQIAAFSTEGIPLRISVNVSPSQLQQVDFISSVKAALSRRGAAPKLLELEITESVAMQNVDLVAERLTRINEIGVSVAIDDFGVGYSNLGSLIRLPFSRLKLDRSLLKNIEQRAEARTLVQTIVSMANSLGFHSVAEGVETKSQLELLSVMGCDVVQGFLLSYPVERQDLRDLLIEQRDKAFVNANFKMVA